MSVIEVKPRKVQFKILFFYIFLMIDVISNSFIEPTFESKIGVKENLAIFYSIIVVQFVTTILLVVSFFTIMWSTFLIRYGIVNYILGHFTITLIVIPLYFAIFALEKLSHILEYEAQDQKITATLFPKQDFQTYYYITHILKIVFYSTLINDVTRLISPKYYKKDFWIK